tara:strand:- start:139 stop:603 length:465 start_codon:yes stop_codon:yes gene_type:complete
MSRGINESLKKLESMIESITPKTDAHHSFICVNDASGIVTPLSERYDAQREFTFNIISAPIDDGAAGLSGRKRITIELEIRYMIIKDFGFNQRMILEDTSYIIDKIKGPDYDFNTTGIISVIPGSSIINVVQDQAAETIGLVSLIQFDLLYLES